MYLCCEIAVKCESHQMIEMNQILENGLIEIILKTYLCGAHEKRENSTHSKL